MTRVEIQRALYDARNEYLKAKKSMEFYAREIAFLNDCEKELDKPSVGYLMKCLVPNLSLDLSTGTDKLSQHPLQSPVTPWKL
ncbi:MAG: hypothetical protein EBU08_18375 [Micrococcales bacterium]|nr:hypothetical protein [Micrococcales bacterium]